ncbi:uncharacterized protein LOC143449776 isoform X2 [Clavelina lepadiformis]|uniref:uncharacterized protein LOC143449776 isoform X2 n=1 Tax=Clavelina lepadiformis TaxID=159417 RepID=UPI0040421709
MQEKSVMFKKFRFFQPYAFIQFSFLLIMSLFESSLSLKSTKDAQQLHVDERTKLISLIRAWRSKHDKVLATAQRHRDVIDTLRNDVERLKEEKEIVTNNLRTTLEKERVKNKRTVEELTIKAETARNEPEIQARNLREKLNRLQDETQPIINLYKKRDERMQTQIAEMNDVIADLTSQRDHLERKLENLKAENEAESQRVAAEREEFRLKYQTNLDEIRKHCAIRLVQMRHQLETTTSDEQKHFTQEFAKQHEGMELQNTQKLEEQRIRLEEEHRRKIEELKEEHSLARHNLGIAHAAELKDLKKKTELANTRLRQKQSESKNLERLVEESTNKLKYIRTELEHDYVGEVIPHYMTATTKTTKDSPVKMKTLLEELSKRMRDLREAKRELEQQDSGRLRIYDATEQERFLKEQVPPTSDSSFSFLVMNQVTDENFTINGQEIYITDHELF